MVERLLKKTGGNAIPVTIGNFADVAVDGEYDLITWWQTRFATLLLRMNRFDAFGMWHSIWLTKGYFS